MHAPCIDAANSLTIDNASSTRYTLTVMTWVARRHDPRRARLPGLDVLGVPHAGSAVGDIPAHIGAVAPPGPGVLTVCVVRPLDPRLLRHARAARGYVVLTAALGALTAALVVAQACCWPRRSPASAADGAPLADARRAPVAGLVAVVARHARPSRWAQERFAPPGRDRRPSASCAPHVLEQAVGARPGWRRTATAGPPWRP